MTNETNAKNISESIKSLQEAFENTKEALKENNADGRALAVAITQFETAVMWLEKSARK